MVIEYYAPWSLSIMLLGLFLYIPFRGQPVAKWDEGWEQEEREHHEKWKRKEMDCIYIDTQRIRMDMR